MTMKVKDNLHLYPDTRTVAEQAIPGYQGTSKHQSASGIDWGSNDMMPLGGWETFLRNEGGYKSYKFYHQYCDGKIYASNIIQVIYRTLIK